VPRAPGLQWRAARRLREDRGSLHGSQLARVGGLAAVRASGRTRASGRAPRKPEAPPGLSSSPVLSISVPTVLFRHEWQMQHVHKRTISAPCLLRAPLPSLLRSDAACP
jgi:hypothetical protein